MYILSSQLPAVLQARYNDRPILHGRTVATVILDHEVHCQTQLPTTVPRYCLAKSAVDNLRIVDDTRDVVPAAHEAPVFAGLTIDILREDLHHVFFGI